MSFIRRVHVPAIETLPKSGAYVWSMSSAPMPERLCSVLVVSSGATRSTLRSPMYVWLMSIATDTDVAVPESGTVMVSDTVLANVMAMAGERVCVNCPKAPPVPVLPGESAKSAASAPVTFSLNVTRYTSVWLSVFSDVGSCRSIDETVGGVVSAGTVLTV